MGATVLNGPRLAKGCLIGAGALIAEGKEIPDGSLVRGAPERVIRQLTRWPQAPSAEIRRRLTAANMPPPRAFGQACAVLKAAGGRKALRLTGLTQF